MPRTPLSRMSRNVIFCGRAGAGIRLLPFCYRTARNSTKKTGWWDAIPALFRVVSTLLGTAQHGFHRSPAGMNVWGGVRRCLRMTSMKRLRAGGSSERMTAVRHRTSRFRVRAKAHPGDKRFALAWGMTAFRPSLRGLRVIRDRRARADQIAVAIGIVDPADRRPIFVRA